MGKLLNSSQEEEKLSVANESKMHFSFKIKFQIIHRIEAPTSKIQRICTIVLNVLAGASAVLGGVWRRVPVHIIRLMHWSRPAAFTVFISWETLAIKTFRQSLKVIFTADRLHINYTEL